MDWKSGAVLLIFFSSFILSFFRKKISPDLVFLIGGASTLFMGIMPAREFMQTVWQEPFLTSISLFFLAASLREIVLEKTLNQKVLKEVLKLFSEKTWIFVLGGLLFAAALEQTNLPEQLAQFLYLTLGNSPFLLVSFLLGSSYVLAQCTSPFFVLSFAFPLIFSSLAHASIGKDPVVVAVLINLIATLFAFFNHQTKARVRATVRVPVVIVLLLICSFLIPQFFLTK
jgi:di/tricarboxylate transporter